MSCYLVLKEKQRNLREGFSANLGLRTHRALSWLNKAEQSQPDLDAEFIFLWIAFNSAYASEFHSYLFSEKKKFGRFLKIMEELDSQQVIYNLLWKEFTGSIRVLLDNKFVFQPFWDFQNQKISEQFWLDEFNRAKNSASRALGQKRTAKLLGIIFSRLYTLRNQVLHGGATWNSKVNREQLRDACALLRTLVPAIINIMMDNPNRVWGEPAYPVVN